MKRHSLLALVVLFISLLLLPVVSSAQGRSDRAPGRNRDVVRPNAERADVARTQRQQRIRVQPVQPVRPPVNAVPEPGAALLFGAGLVTISAVTRRRRNG